MARVQGEEENAETQRQRQDDADGDVAPSQPIAEEAHRDPRDEREDKQSPQRTRTDEDRAGRAGKADVGQRMTRERQMAQHQEESHRAGKSATSPPAMNAVRMKS